MYRESDKLFPQWSLQDCSVKTIRKESVYSAKFKHELPFSGGDGAVYSVTMRPYHTKSQKVTYNGADDISLRNGKGD